MSFTKWNRGRWISHIPFLALMPILLVTECSGNVRDKKTSSYVLEQIGGRRVFMVFPEGPCPEGGWPVVILLHGRAQSGGAWFGEGPLSLGEQKFFPPVLVNAGFAVIAPDGSEPLHKGVKEWDSLHRIKERSQDLLFFDALFSWMEKNQKPKFNMEKVYVAGISSGGFMAGRLAQAMPQKICAAAVISAGNADFFRFDKDLSLAEETGASAPISPGHPPTIILHGAKDNIVPVERGKEYHQELLKAGVETRIYVIPDGRHQWPGSYNDKIIQWFTSHGKTASIDEKKESHPAELIFYKQDSGKKIALRTGDIFQVQLKGVPTAGYKWEIKDLDLTKLKMADEGVKSLTPPRMVGGSSLFLWRFQAAAPGDCLLVIKYFRPWEGPDKALDTFTLDLAIAREK